MTRRAKRENLQQKQILVPELCDVHPFPASLWRKAVCLPAMLYRVNCLLIAEELRRRIAVEAHIGLASGKLNESDSCPPLRFGFCDISQTCTKQNEESVTCVSLHQLSGDYTVECGLTDALVPKLEDIHMDADHTEIVGNSCNCQQCVNCCCSQRHAANEGCCNNIIDVTSCTDVSDCTSQLLLNDKCAADNFDKVNRVINSACISCSSRARFCFITDNSDFKTSACGDAHTELVCNDTATLQCCSFSLDADTSASGGPSPCDVIQALTMSNANDFFNLERLETIGDSFLKFAISIYLYCMYPGIHEGKLSYLRSIQVEYHFAAYSQ